MKKILLKLINSTYWERQEKSFVIAMMLMGIFNFSIVIFMINR